MPAESRAPQLLPAWVDFLPNAEPEQVERTLRQRFEGSLEGAVTRYRQLPTSITHVGPFCSLLDEARQLYVSGRFYSCVVMSGIAAERILKDLLSGAASRQAPARSGPKGAKRLRMPDVIGSLAKSGKLDQQTDQAARELVRLRNEYAHARGAGDEADARTAITCVHAVVDGTESVLRDYEIVDGVFVARRNRASDP